MESQEKNTQKIGINFGLILGSIMIIIGIVMYATDMAFKQQQWPVNIYYLAFPLVIIYAINQFKKQNNGLLNLKDALKAGIIVAFISALVYVVYILLFNYVMDPEYNSKIMDFATEKIAESDAPVEAKEMQLKMIELFSSPLAGSLIWVALSLFFGFIYSLIGGLIMKKTDA